MVRIKNVIPDSPAYCCGAEKGDILKKINGHDIADVLDYMYYAAENNVVLELERDGSELVMTAEKDEYDDLGLEFDTFLMDSKRSCCNKCVFCFIDQMPPGMRETLYFKDDDARLSFLQGNYVTLTNLEQSDIDRIIKMKLNINVSVHTTNPELPFLFYAYTIPYRKFNTKHDFCHDFPNCDHCAQFGKSCCFC